MFKIVSVELCNFRSFIDEHIWKLNEKPGLYYLTGKNHENTRLGRNGVGKSSLLDAIVWSLYGRSTQGVRGPHIVTRGHSSCSVSVTLVVGDEEFTVKRTQNPNSLKIDDQPVDQEALTKKIRLNFESFLYAIISPQAGNSFLDLSAGEKLNLFSQIMDLDYWLERSELAAEQAKGIEHKKGLAETRITGLTSAALTLASTIDDLKIKSKQFEKKKLEQISSLLGVYSLVSDKIEILTEKIDKIEVPAHEKMLDIEKKIRAFEEDENTLSTELIEVYKEQARINSELNWLNDEEVSINEIEAKCPTCKQVVDQKHLAKERAKLTSRKNKLKEEKDDAGSVIEEIQKNKSEIAIAAATQEALYKTLKSEERKAEQEKNALLTQISYAELEVTRLKGEIKKVKEQANEFDQLIIQKQNELDTTNQSIEIKKHEVIHLNEDHAAVHFWIGGFKRLRLHIIEETLRSLEVEVNNNLVALGLGDWKIEFDIERENKSGGVTRGFVTMITDPEGFAAPYETVSAGEKQRIKLAGAFGLADLIVERVGLVSHVELYDEVTQHMGIEGIEDTLNILRDRAINTDKTVYLIDHQTIEYGDFSGTINLIKDENGSRFV